MLDYRHLKSDTQPLLSWPKTVARSIKLLAIKSYLAVCAFSGHPFLRVIPHPFPCLSLGYKLPGTEPRAESASESGAREKEKE